MADFEMVIEAANNAVLEKNLEARKYMDNNTSFGTSALIFTACILAFIILIWYYEAIKDPSGEYVSDKTGTRYVVNHSVMSGIVTIKNTETGDGVYSGHKSIGSERIQVWDCDRVERVAFVAESKIYWTAVGEYQGTIWRRVTKKPSVW